MTFYDDIYPFYTVQRTPFIFSSRLLTIILVFLVLAVSLLLILPGIRGKSVSATKSKKRKTITHCKWVTKPSLSLSAPPTVVAEKCKNNSSCNAVISVSSPFFSILVTWNNLSVSSSQRLFWTFRIVTSLFIGAVIVGEFCIRIVFQRFYSSCHLCFLDFQVNFFPAALNFTNDWAEARMTTKATYKSFSNAVVNAEIGLHVGLYGINVTLKGEWQ